MSSVVFDMSMFKGVDNYETIVRIVTKLCETKVGIPNLSNVKLPWSQAVAFAGLSKTELKELPKNYDDDQLVKVVVGHSKLFNLMAQWTMIKDAVSSIKDKMKNAHIQYVEEWLTSVSSFNQFFNRLKYVIQKMQYEANQINRVWYGYLKGS